MGNIKDFEILPTELREAEKKEVEELRATIKALQKKTNLTDAEIDSERKAKYKKSKVREVSK